MKRQININLLLKLLSLAILTQITDGNPPSVRKNETQMLKWNHSSFILIHVESFIRENFNKNRKSHQLLSPPSPFPPPPPGGFIT